MPESPWHLKDPEALTRLQEDVLERYPGLHFEVLGDTVCVCGHFPVAHDGNVLDSYSIEIELPRDYPKSIPILREVDGRIPRIEDRHINPANGSACLFLPDERWRVYPPGSTLLDYLDGPVRNFFIGQSLIELGDPNPWPAGEHAHGVEGILQYYSEILEIKNSIAILQFLRCLAKNKLKGHWDCPCGSGKRIRHCHMLLLTDLRTKISPETARHSCNQVEAQLKKHAANFNR